jgi:hypothetical protein
VQNQKKLYKLILWPLVTAITLWLFLQYSAHKFNDCLSSNIQNIMGARWEERSLGEVMQQYLTASQRDNIIKASLYYDHLSRLEILDYIRESIKEELTVSDKLRESCEQLTSCKEFECINFTFIMCEPF